MLVRQTFSNSLFANVMKQSRKGAAVQFFGLFNMFTIEVCSETGLFKNLTNYVFRSV